MTVSGLWWGSPYQYDGVFLVIRGPVNQQQMRWIGKVNTTLVTQKVNKGCVMRSLTATNTALPDSESEISLSLIEEMGHVITVVLSVTGSYRPVVCYVIVNISVNMSYP